MCFDENGRPAYHPTGLLKLFIYGYLNRIRSSRGLEKECYRNIEVMWLLNSLKPDHNTISNFRRDNGKAIEKQLKETGGPQVSTPDPESRQMIARNNNTEVAYNIQTTVGPKHNIPFGYKVTNTNDSKAMGGMFSRATYILNTNRFTALYDKGYHTGTGSNIADGLGVRVMVAIPAMPKSSQAPDPEYNVENFIFNETENTYTCPQGHLLATNGTWHKTSNGSSFQQYKTKMCIGCKVREKCTTPKLNGKIVQRRKYAQNITANKERVENNKETYKRRQSIVGYPYGTIKRQWGFSYIMAKKYMHRANADVGLIMTAYNLRRIINILGIETITAYLKMLAFYFLIYLTQYNLKK
jgi:hypothetical protein